MNRNGFPADCHSEMCIRDSYSTARIASGAFVRLKEVSLSYDFPKEWLKSTPISSVGLKIQGTNLALLYADSKLNGQDPEFFRSGGVRCV